MDVFNQHNMPLADNISSPDRNSINKIPVLSFFTGAGLLDIGFIEAGFDIIWHNEYDPAFVSGFEYGMRKLFPSKSKATSTIQNSESIQNLSAATILDQAFHNTGRPSIFGVIGGPPCPDFSNGGKHKGIAGKNGILSAVFIDIIIDIQPTFFLFENVPGIVKTKSNRSFLAVQLERLQQHYQLDINLLNALEFGAPQNRNRFFMIGFRKDWVADYKGLILPQQAKWLFHIEAIRQKHLSTHTNGHKYHQLSLSADPKMFTWPCHAKYAGARHRYNWPAVSFFGDNPPRPIDIPANLMVWTHIGDSQKLIDLPNGKDVFRAYSDKFKTIPEGDVSGKSFKRLHRWRYSPPAAYGNNEVHLHPTLPRRLTVREVLRIQTVPDTYALPPDMTLSHKFKTIANGVPVVLSYSLANAIANYLSDNLSKTTEPANEIASARI